MIKVVIDTNVIISALLNPDRTPALIISLILDGQLKICLSDAIFKEYREVLGRPKFSKMDRGAIRQLFSLFKKIGLWVDPVEKIDLIKTDPDDNIFLECAQEACADFIVTGNIKHFPKTTFKTALILTPSDFIDWIASNLFSDPKNI